MATFTLKNLKAAADKKYGSTTLDADGEVFELPHMLRLDPEVRKEISARIDTISEDMDLDEQIVTFRDIVVLAEKDGKGEKLAEILSDPALLFEFVSGWLEATQAGEA